MERVIIGLAVGITWPLLTFVALWWTTAALHLYVFRLPTDVIIAAAFAGLALGLWLDVIYLRRCVNGFFSANLWLLVSVYLCLCVVAIAFFMGVPVGTFLLGIAAGFYIGRRNRHCNADKKQLSAAIRRVATFTAFVTAVGALPIGLLALQSELHIQQELEGALGLSPLSLQGGSGLVLVGFLCLLLFVIQYSCSAMAGRLAFRINATEAQVNDIAPEAPYPRPLQQEQVTRLSTPHDGTGSASVPTSMPLKKTRQ